MIDLRSPFAADFTPDAAATLAAHLKVLADPTRLQIIALLAKYSELSAVDIQDILGLKQPTASHHLLLLDAARLTRPRMLGAHKLRTLDADAVAAVADLLRPDGAR